MDKWCKLHYYESKEHREPLNMVCLTFFFFLLLLLLLLLLLFCCFFWFNSLFFFFFVSCLIYPSFPPLQFSVRNAYINDKASGPGRQNLIILETKKRTFYMCADSHDGKIEWLEALKAAGAKMR